MMRRGAKTAGTACRSRPAVCGTVTGGCGATARYCLQDSQSLPHSIVEGRCGPRGSVAATCIPSPGIQAGTPERALEHVEIERLSLFRPAFFEPDGFYRSEQNKPLKNMKIADTVPAFRPGLEVGR